MSSPYRPLLPSANPSAASGPSSDVTASLTPWKRTIVLAACLSCHKAKAKCDGARPACARCLSRATSCEYTVEPNTTRMLSLKKKYAVICQENDQLKELLLHLQTKTEADAIAILKRIREDPDPFAVLAQARHGTAESLLRPTNHSKDDQICAIVEQIDAEAFKSSSVKVAARPWTSVAGDGAVSELLSIFFEREYPFILSFVDKDGLLEDLASAKNPDTAMNCSPLLLNVICALAAFGSETVRRIDAVRGGSLRESFFDEFKIHFDRNGSQSSMTTAQALFIAYAGCEMMKRLGVGKFGSPRDQPGPTDTRRRAIESRINWGLFLQESIAAFLYLQPSLIPPPSAPRYFCDPITARPHDKTLDLAADLSAMLFEILSHDRDESTLPGTSEDITKRMSYYRKVKLWERGSPHKCQYSHSDMREYHYTRAYYHLAVLAVFRPIQWWHGILPDQLGTPTSVCISHCCEMMNEIIACLASLPSEWSGSWCLLFFTYCCAFTLVSTLGIDQRTHEPFTQACRIFYHTSKSYPLSTGLLQGLKARSRQLQLELPEQCQPYFAHVALGKEASSDVPITFILPQPVEVNSNIGDVVSNQSGLELGHVIRRWSVIVPE